MSLDQYTTIFVEAYKRGRPQTYRNDLLVHDYRRLHCVDDPPKTFGWVLRELGTEMLDVRMNRESLLGYIGHYELDGKDNLYYIYHNGELKRLPFERWVMEMHYLNTPDPRRLRRHQGY